jgi:hypothetical protein
MKAVAELDVKIENSLQIKENHLNLTVYKLVFLKIKIDLVGV